MDLWSLLRGMKHKSLVRMGGNAGLWTCGGCSEVGSGKPVKSLDLAGSSLDRGKIEIEGEILFLFTFLLLFYFQRFSFIFKLFLLIIFVGFYLLSVFLI
ncbi:hypothetical protein EO92_11470 [Methanosarcina sp. 2.H.A.1B.4]|nr:hypothetical protein EO92_11470 [Methanosarcina sp. 2.H.A.1B.4]